ncbi:MAG: hypothetical protein ACRD1P_00175 [Thermoanaerobaculia bacterium]
MIDLPESEKLRYLRKALTRGTVFWFKSSLLDDGEHTVKEKFAVVVCSEVENDEILFVYATSRVEKYQSTPFVSETVPLPVGSYPFFKKETLLNVRDLKAIPLVALAKLLPGAFEVKGSLSAEDVKRLDKTIMAARSIVWQQKVRCLPKKDPPPPKP